MPLVSDPVLVVKFSKEKREHLLLLKWILHSIVLQQKFYDMLCSLDQINLHAENNYVNWIDL